MADNIYSELRHDRQEIRLIFLEAGEPEDDISASLMVTSLRWAPEYWTPQYEALSYVWGDPLITRPIKLNGQPWQVTENLEAGLRRLRYADRVRIMWIDAICINQQDPREQEHQIRFMQDIFQRCAQCVVWLGEEDEDTEKALEPLRWLEENSRAREWPCFDSFRTSPLDKEQDEFHPLAVVLTSVKVFATPMVLPYLDFPRIRPCREARDSMRSFRHITRGYDTQLRSSPLSITFASPQMLKIAEFPHASDESAIRPCNARSHYDSTPI